MARTEGEGVLERRATRSKASAWWLRPGLLLVLTALMVADLYLIFMWAPTATSEHRFNLQRVFYFHVPIAWVALLGYCVVFVGSIGYLWKRDARWDALAQSAAEVGLIFATLVLVTGSIWGKGIWGQWWTWEPRLTTMLILWLIYLTYIMIRGYVSNPSQGARFAAVVGIVGFIDVPIVYFAANWWRGLHPEVVTGPLADTGSLDSSMRGVLYFSLLTFVVLFGFLVRERMSLRAAGEAVRRLKYSIQGATIRS